MTPTQSQIDGLHRALLEWQGICPHANTEYYCIEDGNSVDSGFKCKDCGKDTYGNSPPDLTLEWLRECAAALSTDQQFAFLGHLSRVIGNRGAPEWRRAFQNIHASKEHRLIALCLTLGLAKEITDQLKGEQ